MADLPEETKPADESQTPESNTEDFGSAFVERSEGQKPEEETAAAKAPVVEEEKKDAAPAPSNQDAPAEKAAAQPGSVKPDPWTGLSPEQAEYFKRLQRSEQAQRGRVAALTKKTQSGSQPEARPPSEQRQDPAPQGDADKPDRAQRLKASAEEYPDAVAAIVEELEESRAEIKRLSDMVKPVADDRDAAEMTEAYSNLEKDHPDFREIAEDESWTNWLQDQPANVQKLGNSWEPAEVSAALRLFKAERAEATAGQEPAKPSATDEKRGRQLDGSRIVPSRGAPVATGVPDDFSSAFRARTNKG